MVKPLSQLPADLTKRVTRIDKAINDSIRDTVRAAAIAAKDAQLDEMRGDTGGDLILSRVRSGKGARIGTRYDLTGTGKNTLATIRATGPVPLVANPTKPHPIPKVGPRARRRKRLAIPGVGVRMNANHPGTRGKDTWNDGRVKAVPRVTAIVERRTDNAVTKAFKAGL
jgi:hypothetical protein